LQKNLKNGEDKRLPIIIDLIIVNHSAAPIVLQIAL